MRSRRCFICGARAFEPTDRTLTAAGGVLRAFDFACGSCGLLVQADADLAGCAAGLARRLSGARFAASEAVDYGLDAFTLRIAASRQRRGVHPHGEVQQAGLRQPHSLLAAEAELFALDDAPQAPLTLGICCRPGELDGVLDALDGHADWAAGVVILVDATAQETASIDVRGFDAGAVRIAARPMGGDFAAQRNALSSFSPSGWMVQLDADETLEPGTGALLGAIAFDAERQGVVSIGLRRRNLVGGVMSDLFPDTQYRLNHASVVYGGHVHERPITDWRQTSIALHGAILHHMSRSHVETRSQRYEAMHPGGGRTEEVDRLLTPYRD